MKEKKVKKTPRELKLLRISKLLKENQDRADAFRHYLLSQTSVYTDGATTDRTYQQ
jgi:hypothetical protein